MTEDSHPFIPAAVLVWLVFTAVSDLTCRKKYVVFLVNAVVRESSWTCVVQLPNIFPLEALRVCAWCLHAPPAYLTHGTSPGGSGSGNRASGISCAT